MITNEQIKIIISQTASIHPNGSVWGYDTEIDHIDNLTETIRDIIEHPEKWIRHKD